MKSSLWWAGVLAGAFLWMGCRRDGVEHAGSEPPPVEAVPASVQEAFAGASEEVRHTATAAAGDIQADPANAYQGFEAIMMRPDITPEQRKAAADALSASLLQLQRAAAAGDRRAQEAMEARAARK